MSPTSDVAASVSAGADGALAAKAAGLRGFANEVGRIADQAAAREGGREGALAGMDPEFRPRRDGTIRGEAFDAAGIDTYAKRIQTEFSVALDQAAAKHAADPAGMAKALDSVHAGFQADAIDEVRPGLANTFQRARLTHMRQAARAQAATVRARQAAALQGDLETRIASIQRGAYGMGLDDRANGALAADLEDLRTSLATRDPTGQLLIGPQAADKLMRSLRADISRARVLGAFSRIDGVPAKQQFIAEFERSFGGGDGSAETLDLRQYEQIRGTLLRELSRATSAAGASTRELAREVRAVVDVAEKGYVPDADAVTSLRARTAAAGAEDLTAALDTVDDAAAFQRSLVASTPVQLDAFVRAERARVEDGATPADVARIEAAERTAGAMRTALKQDPLGWAERAGVADIPAIDLTSPDAAAASLKNRAAMAEEVAGRYGQRVRYFRPAEVSALKVVAERGGDDAVQFARSIAESLGANAVDAFGEISDEAPAFAMLGGLVLSGGGRGAVDDAAEGIALRQTDGFKSMAPTRIDRDTATERTYGLAFSSQPRTQQSLQALADAIYEVRARRAGVTDFDDGLYREALRAAVGERTIGGYAHGGIVSFRGRDVVVPPDVAQWQFDDLIDAIRLDDFSSPPRDANGAPLSVSAIRRGTLVTQGNGRYWIALGDPDGDDPQWLAGETPGKPFVLDLPALLPKLRARVGDD
ncbi:MAG: hypothetical protein AAFQ35_12240 [Pseudomonadota bacterium]